MEIALLPLDTRGQAEADCESGVVVKEERIAGWSWPCYKSLLYCPTGTAISPACKGNICKSLPPNELCPEAAV